MLATASGSLEGTVTSRPYSSVRPVLMGRRGVGWEPYLEGRLRAAAAPSPEVRRPRPPFPADERRSVIQALSRWGPDMRGPVAYGAT